MPTKNAHHTHENASGQDTTLPNFSFAFSAPATRKHAISSKFQQIHNESIKPKHKQNTTFFTRSKNKKKFSKLDCSLFFETAQNNIFPNQKHDFHEFQKGPKHKQNAYISQSSHNDKNMLQ